MIDKGNIGSLVGGLVLGGVAVTTGLSALYIVGATVVGAIGGHYLAEPHHYKPIYQH